MKDIYTTRWQEVQIKDIDVFRSHKLDDLSGYINEHKEESLAFANEVFQLEEKESYAKAIECMITHAGAVPLKVLQYALQEKGSDVFLEALLYLRIHPNSHIDPDLIKYLDETLNTRNIGPYKTMIKIAISTLIKTEVTPIKESVLLKIRQREDVFNAIPKDIQQSINHLLRNTGKKQPKKQPSYTQLMPNHYGHAV